MVSTRSSKKRARISANAQRRNAKPGTSRSPRFVIKAVRDHFSQLPVELKEEIDEHTMRAEGRFDGCVHISDKSGRPYKTSVWYNNMYNDISGEGYINELESRIARNVFIRNATFELRFNRDARTLTRTLNPPSGDEDLNKLKHLEIFPMVESADGTTGRMYGLAKKLHFASQLSGLRVVSQPHSIWPGN
jgi:hypothetical protein